MSVLAVIGGTATGLVNRRASASGYFRSVSAPQRFRRASSGFLSLSRRAKQRALTYAAAESSPAGGGGPVEEVLYHHRPQRQSRLPGLYPPRSRVQVAPSSLSLAVPRLGVHRPPTNQTSRSAVQVERAMMDAAKGSTEKWPVALMAQPRS